MKRLLIALAACALCGLIGYALGQRSSLPAIQVGTATPREEADLSPPKEHRTVLAPRIQPGTPKKPPAPVPAHFGHQVSTTATDLTDIGTFHAATFASLKGRELELRTVEWLDTPAGRATLGDAQTTAAPLRLVLPPAPQWGVSLLVPVGEGRPKPGVHVQWTPGPLILGGGHLAGHTFIQVGGRW